MAIKVVKWGTHILTTVVLLSLPLPPFCPGCNCSLCYLKRTFRCQLVVMLPDAACTPFSWHVSHLLKRLLEERWIERWHSALGNVNVLWLLQLARFLHVLWSHLPHCHRCCVLGTTSAGSACMDSVVWGVLGTVAVTRPVNTPVIFISNDWYTHRRGCIGAWHSGPYRHSIEPYATAACCSRHSVGAAADTVQMYLLHRWSFQSQPMKAVVCNWRAAQASVPLWMNLSLSLPPPITATMPHAF